MSKPVRISDYLLEQIERLADEENRSLANMVHVLLEQALKMEAVSDAGLPQTIGLGDHIKQIKEPTDADAQPRDIPARMIDPTREFKPDFKPTAKPKKSRYGK